MDRSQAVSSKICSRRVEKIQLDSHRARIDKIKPSVDTNIDGNRMPKGNNHDHIRNNLKKEQMMEERYSEIDRTNRILLKKMSDIMRAPNCIQQISPGPRSMNRGIRQRELMRITKDNQIILRRIQYAQPVLSHEKWERDHLKQTEYLKRTIEYPLVIRTPRRAPHSARLAPIDEYNRSIDAPLSERGRRRISQGPPNLQLVFRDVSTFEDIPYAVEMSTDDRDTLYITAHDEVARNTLELMINGKLHRKLMAETHGDYDLIADRLRLDENHKLVLDELPQQQVQLTEPEPLEITTTATPRNTLADAPVPPIRNFQSSLLDEMGAPTEDYAPARRHSTSSLPDISTQDDTAHEVLPTSPQSVEWDADRITKKVIPDATVEIEESTGEVKVRGLTPSSKPSSAMIVGGVTTPLSKPDSASQAVVGYQGSERPVFTFMGSRGSRGSENSEADFDKKMGVSTVRGNSAETVDDDGTGSMNLRAEIDMSDTNSDLMFRIRGLTPESSNGSAAIVFSTSKGSQGFFA